MVWNRWRVRQLFFAIPWLLEPWNRVATESVWIRGRTYFLAIFVISIFLLSLCFGSYLINAQLSQLRSNSFGDNVTDFLFLKSSNGKRWTNVGCVHHNITTKSTSLYLLKSFVIRAWPLDNIVPLLTWIVTNRDLLNAIKSMADWFTNGKRNVPIPFW